MSNPKQAGRGRPVETAGRAKKDLLKVAIRLLSSVGREGATARAICAEAGVGAPAMYHHYGDLNGLHRAAINQTFRAVAASYRRGARTKGTRQGIHDGWLTFMRFANEEPRMCRIVIQQILIGEPPQAVASTLENAVRDMSRLEEQGRMNCSPEFAVRLLWAGALGAACFTVAERRELKNGEDVSNDQAVQRTMLEALLDSLALGQTET
ncbi:TetR/AcrR family transcriptional regulator [Pseudoduganella namucuonensis]|uniref:Transcriptional regulator, TetR family n=1 Tax=Pseudoduganella namucuonensis TaxID=1035707 RepID=A0A1I7KZ39_9BURK|nr:TetR/AcrR family transcriptional regulator [Pseudoduganella namucuonensis]SFV02554.1 transcriptional regulator, TetR family [Pseudoduganella namucuonensis]